MSARLFVAASTNQTNPVANILWLAGIGGDPDLLHQYVEQYILVQYCQFGISATVCIHVAMIITSFTARWRSSWRLSLDEILQCIDCEAEFNRSR